MLYNPNGYGKSVLQLFKYGVVGIVTNTLGYAVYLLFTWLGTTPKITMTVLYAVVATAGYFGNRNFTFRHKGSQLTSGLRYCIAHALGYIINLLMLFVLVDQMGYRHQYVQAAAIFVVALFLFISFKMFVFRDGSTQVNDSRLQR